MSYDENDAAYDRFIDELHKDFREQALDDAELYDKIVDDFKTSRLRAVYVQDPAVAEPAQGALREASDLQMAHPRAALVFAIMAAEVCGGEHLAGGDRGSRIGNAVDADHFRIGPAPGRRERFRDPDSHVVIRAHHGVDLRETLHEILENLDRRQPPVLPGL